MNPGETEVCGDGLDNDCDGYTDYDDFDCSPCTDNDGDGYDICDPGNPDDTDGLPADCAAPDDLSTEIGADDDPNVIAALSYLNTGACPADAVADGQQKPRYVAPPQERDWQGTPAQRYLDAY